MHIQYFTVKEDGTVFLNNLFSLYFLTYFCYKLQNRKNININMLFFPLVPLKLHSAATCNLLACDLHVTNKKTILSALIVASTSTEYESIATEKGQDTVLLSYLKVNHV